MDIFGWNIPVWLILAIVIFLLWYKYATAYYGMFKAYGIPGPRPIPGVGTMMYIFTHPKGMFGFDLDLHKRYKSDVIRIFFGREPALIFFNPEVVKQILVKDFNSFTDRRTADYFEYPLDKMMTLLKGDEWRCVRYQVSPTFTGIKLRKTVSLVNVCASNLVKNLEVPAKSGDMIECKEYAGSYTMDAIASTAFNIDINSKNDKNNIFVQMGKRLFDFPGLKLRLFVMVCFPFLMPVLSKLGFSLFDPQCMKFFIDVIEKAIKHRKEHPDESPNDFLGLLLDAQKDIQDDRADKENSPQTESQSPSARGLTKGEILGQSLIFFFAGYETTANALALTLHNLAVHQDAQEKAYQEIMDVVPEGEDPTYDQLKKLKYLEMCFEETLRMYPPAPQFDRSCTADTELSGIKIKKGVIVAVPVHALQNDPAVWPNPDHFDPERFTEEAKSSRHPFQYLPFGDGPRNCIGQRLAVLEIKVALVHVLRAYKLEKCQKTQVPLKMMKVKAEAVGGAWIKITKRQ